jgi:hypothetical protein
MEWNTYMNMNIMILVVGLVIKMSEHKSHYFVVDKSNKFSKCSHCGLVRERKIIGWDTQEKEGMIAELERDHKEGNL